MKNPTNGGRRGRHRRRWTATSLLLGILAAAMVPYLLFVHEDSQAAAASTVRSGMLAQIPRAGTLLRRTPPAWLGYSP